MWLHDTTVLTSSVAREEKDPNRQREYQKTGAIAKVAIKDRTKIQQDNQRNEKESNKRQKIQMDNQTKER